MLEGRDQWIAMAGEGMRHMQAIQHTTMTHLVEVEGDEATVTFNRITAHVPKSESSDQPTVHYIGSRPTWKLRRTPGGWRFAGTSPTHCGKTRAAKTQGRAPRYPAPIRGNLTTNGRNLEALRRKSGALPVHSAKGGADNARLGQACDYALEERSRNRAALSCMINSSS